MKIDQERAAHDARENDYHQEIAKGRKSLARRVHQKPARDDRGERKAWRPGDR